MLNFSPAGSCGDLQEITAMFCTTSWTTSVKCLRAAGCGERVFILVLLIFYFHEKNNPCSYPLRTLLQREGEHPALHWWWGWGGLMDHAHVYPYFVLNLEHLARSQWRRVTSAPVTEPGAQPPGQGGSLGCSLAEHPGAVGVR